MYLGYFEYSYQQCRGARRHAGGLAAIECCSAGDMEGYCHASIFGAPNFVMSQQHLHQQPFDGARHQDNLGQVGLQYVDADVKWWGFFHDEHVKRFIQCKVTSHQLYRCFTLPST